MRHGDGIGLFIERKMVDARRTDLFMEAHDSPIGSGVDMYMSGKNVSSSDTVNMTLYNNKSNDQVNLITRGF
jgi:hypothetical protein